MGRSVESFNKKEREKKKSIKARDKKEKAEERKANSGKKSMEDMMAYIDEFGNITSTPPDPARRAAVIAAEEIQISVPKQEEMAPPDPNRKGVVTFFNTSKGFGFIKDTQSQESIFVHVNALQEAIGENDKVTFEVEQGPKGLNAVRVKKAVK
ncbi:cold-shock protein [Mucilaginibacter myungsuensis]|uniref:Cold shock domain-containing protein n=1 Tax=Mucilaginibacter myungsuensis TaxID=649104 RepID=A0A929KXQ6_9SPHI|nr:cold shock domain-containing protein [Mucilaginibacter myungsuensis]MBE9662440.1 cold shock domain-containing protein [Mucilaginibacter myungsuensis]MDN3599123.1 cold shock domain-containing protein [Mucilaginibacter myungsuensis]